MWFTVIIIILIFLGGIIFSIYDETPSWVIIGFLGSILIGIFISLFSYAIGNNYPADEIYKTEEIKILAFQDNSSTSNSFFIGSEDTSYYYYLKETENGGKILDKIKTENVIIYENEEENPHITITYKRNSNNLVNFFFITERTTTEIYIPKGSIKYQYNIDLE